MIEALLEIAVFAVKIIIVLALVGSFVAITASLTRVIREEKDHEDPFTLVDLKDEHRRHRQEMSESAIEFDSALSPKERKKKLSALKKSFKEAEEGAKDEKSASEPPAAAGQEAAGNGEFVAVKEGPGPQDAPEAGTVDPAVQSAPAAGKEPGIYDYTAPDFVPENLYVLSFDGSTRGDEVRELSLAIDRVLCVAGPGDEVVVRLTSPGGLVNAYGLCASELMRIRNQGIHLVCCVDSVAASGGYMMAAVCHRIVAAPFAYIGSIGVVAALPNFHRFMDRHQVDYEQVTAGRYKRTMTMFGRNTNEAREKMKQDLEAIHFRFKEEVKKFRPHIDLERTATGEYWLAADALGLGLVDEIATFSEYLSRRLDKIPHVAVLFKPKEKPQKGIAAILKHFFKMKSGQLPLADGEQDWYMNIK